MDELHDMDEKELEFRETIKNALTELMEHYAENGTNVASGMATIFAILNGIIVSCIVSFSEVEHMTEKQTEELIENLNKKLCEIAKKRCKEIKTKMKNADKLNNSRFDISDFFKNDE